MSGECRGLCGPYEVGGLGKNPYGGSVCRCTTCGKYLKWDGDWCPCCGTRVRRNPRYSKSKRVRAEPRLDLGIV